MYKILVLVDQLMLSALTYLAFQWLNTGKVYFLLHVMIEEFQFLPSGILESSAGFFLFIWLRAKSTSKESLLMFCGEHITSSHIPLTDPFLWSLLLTAVGWEMSF